jgi:hypothetical protein
MLTRTFLATPVNWLACGCGADCRQDENTAPGGNTAARDAFEAAASLFDMQLPVAVLQLLTGLLARSSVVGPWLQQQGDR